STVAATTSTSRRPAMKRRACAPNRSRAGDREAETLGGRGRAVDDEVVDAALRALDRDAAIAGRGRRRAVTDIAGSARRIERIELDEIELAPWIVERDHERAVVIRDQPVRGLGPGRRVVEARQVVDARDAGERALVGRRDIAAFDRGRGRARSARTTSRLGEGGRIAIRVGAIREPVVVVVPRVAAASLGDELGPTQAADLPGAGKERVLLLHPHAVDILDDG